MEKKQKYYGIKFNGDIPKIDEINKYSDEVEIEFQGKAYLIERRDEQTQKTEIKDGYKLKKEGEYEIEFINLENKIYTLKVRIQTLFLFVILPLLAVGVILLFVLFSPVKELKKLARFINLSILEFEVETQKEPKYEFDVRFKNIESQEIFLKNTVSEKIFAKNKIAPRGKWKIFGFVKYEK